MEKLLLLGTLGILFLHFSFLFPIKKKIAVALWSSVFQIYTLPVLGIYPSLTLLVSLSLLPAHSWKLEAFKWLPIKLFILLILVHALSLLWAHNVRLGVRTIVYLLPFIGVFWATYSVVLHDNHYIENVIKIFIFLVLVEAGIVILFRIDPMIENAFLKSSIAKHLVNPGVLRELFGISPNNVLATDKSGGFFVNGNVASAFLGVCAVVSWRIWAARKKNIFFILTAILIASVFFTGSKTGMALSIILGLIAYLLHIAIIRWPDLGQSVLLFTFGTIILLGISAGVPYLVDSNLIERSEQTLNIRFLMWGHAWKQFLIHPILGQGFGGWEQSIAPLFHSFGLRDISPPHNSLIYLWSQSGLFAGLLGLGFIISIISLGITVCSVNNSELQTLGLCMTMAFLWVFLHGMGDNTGIVGEIHIQPILGSILGLTCARYQIYTTTSE